ncbi:MAG TPA: MBL fold metallo-hydrolase [Azospirillaceae bacterium]|nr:MBL fold metallo-hydrolase [Azospirillaceae bacterium]
MRVTILGCGGSGGVPLIGNDWGDCDPANPRNRRRRCSILVEAAGQVVLVDTPPDLREQLLDANVRHLDAVLYTHSHADHVHGIDDLRAVNWLVGRPMDVYADRETLDDLQSRFDYCFSKPKGTFFARPALTAHEITGPFDINGLEVFPFIQDHGYTRSLGFRFGRFAYSTDVVHLDEAAFAALEGVEVWIVDSTRRTPHPVHAHLEATLGWIERVRPRRAYLTHMNQTMDYDTLMRELPAGVEPAYDGLVIEVAD